ncbi:family 43 glycosylhydrolase [Maribellus comscasis]|uniref:Family 43 glycosylhydrolase n=1 Tax=Maribellus comscasis TaxID=2681766 RepID=A0A6I6JZS1_9BACT|nr:glycoside hydrolase family 43 protein [Maribellus comscasis]QGY46680.1 family 43 glycosylhydrolase [Maribellus comscasis]
MTLKEIFIAFAFLFFLNVASAQKSNDVYMFSYFMGNGEDGLHLAYSYDGLKWDALKNNQSFLTPQVGIDKLMRDPCIISGPDGKFHMVWTVSWGEKGIGYASSEDLVHWSEQKYIPVMEHEPTARNCWAPEVFYDGDSKQYLIFWSTTIPGRFPETESGGDSGYNHRMYCVVTEDFKNFSDTKLLYDQGFNVIDGTLIKAKNKYVLFLKNETRTPPEKNIRIATSKKLAEGYSRASEPITGDYWAEGPTSVKIGQYWIVYFDKYTDHNMGAIRSDDMENWEDISEMINFPEGTRHGTVFKVSNKVLNKLK